MITYREEMKLHDGTEGGKMPYNWRLDAIKWCHKVYALTDFSFKLVEESVQAGWVVWLDADIILKKPVNKQDLFRIIPLGSELVHLGRKDVDYSETSFMAFNLNTIPPLDLLGDMRGLYNSHEVLSYREWHDGFIFERLFNIRSALKIESEFMEQIKHYVKTGNLSQAKKICEVENIPVARLIGRGISKVGKPLDDISKTIENAGKLEIYNLEKNISILATTVSYTHLTLPTNREV